MTDKKEAESFIETDFTINIPADKAHIKYRGQSFDYSSEAPFVKFNPIKCFIESCENETGVIIKAGCNSFRACRTHALDYLENILIYW